MLAFRYALHKAKVTYPVAIQPKLDGLRAIYCRGRLQSRDEHFWNPDVARHILNALASIGESWVLDGEIYVHGWTLQKINSAFAVNRTTLSTSTPQVQFHIFDGFQINSWNTPFIARWKQLVKEIQEKADPSIIQLVFTEIVTSHLNAERRYSEWVAKGYEGTIYRDLSMDYGLSINCGNQENRWNKILKRKGWMDEWFDVLDYELGEGRFSSCIGALICRTSTGVNFAVGTGLTDMDRQSLMQQLPRRVKVQFERYSEDGKPLKPSVIEIDASES